MPTQLPDRKDGYPSHSVPTWLLLSTVAVTALLVLVALNSQAAKWISDSAEAEFVSSSQPETPAAVLTAKRAASTVN